MLVVVATLFVGRGNSVVMSQGRMVFTPPKIPAAIMGVENRRAYLADHYWDNFDLTSTELLGRDSLLGVAFGGYIGVLMMNPPAVAKESIRATLTRSLRGGYEPFEALTTKFEDYLYNPNSPMRDEELYIHVLRYTTQEAAIDDIYKIRPRKQLEMVLKNRTGRVATDFSCEGVSGKQYTLHEITTPYTILFFNSPDCDDCRRVKEYIGRSVHLTQLVRSGRLTIFGVYTERDFAMWRDATYPSTILNSADTHHTITQNRLYDLKALPTLYLLGSDKRVLLKDRSIEEIERALR